MSSIFVTDEYEVFFHQKILHEARTAEELITVLEYQFLDYKARRVNDAVWAQINFDFLRKERESKVLETTHISVLADLLMQII